MKISDRWSVGQNSYKRKSTEFRRGPEWNRAIESWIEDRRNYRFGSDFTKSGGQYTQVRSKLFYIYNT